PVLMGIYLLAIRLIFLYEQEHPLPAMAQEIHIGEARGKALRQAVFQYGLNALVVIMAAIFLPYFGNDIARQAGMENTFFGTVFIAAATSLPELVVSISGVRMGAVDMAVGNLLGSNIFNIFILGLDDIFYRQGSLFAAISPSHLLSLLATIVMTAVAALGVMLKPTRKVWLLGMDTLVIALIYVGLMVLLFFSK
nr:hypothetical protein [Cytophagales bacterium]